MKRCPNCGSEFDNKKFYCLNCGMTLVSGPPSTKHMGQSPNRKEPVPPCIAAGANTAFFCAFVK